MPETRPTQSAIVSGRARGQIFQGIMVRERAHGLPDSHPFRRRIPEFAARQLGYGIVVAGTISAAIHLLVLPPRQWLSTRRPSDDLRTPRTPRHACRASACL
jgi:hypothetical protein